RVGPRRSLRTDRPSIYTLCPALASKTAALTIASGSSSRNRLGTSFSSWLLRRESCSTPGFPAAHARATAGPPAIAAKSRTLSSSTATVIMRWPWRLELTLVRGLADGRSSTHRRHNDDRWSQRRRCGRATWGRTAPLEPDRRRASQAAAYTASIYPRLFESK